MKLNPLSAALLGAGVAVVGTAGAIDLPHLFRHDERPTVVAQAAPQAGERVVPPAPMSTPPGQVPNYRAIVKQSAPAVVGVTVEGSHKASLEEQGLPPGLEDDPFFRFFRGVPGFGQRGRQGPSMPFKGMGSGFIISPDGVILTNAHVVRDAKDVTVKLSDRREFTAKVLGIDTATDIAVLKIDAKGLPVVRLGDPKNLEVGDPVLAIGAPYGLEQTATSGIVSAKGRSLPGDAVVPFIQTDAAVNPGNSGGPLFNLKGEVIGINSQIYSRSGGFQGIAFAVPIDVASHVQQELVSHGRVDRGRLGVSIQEVTQSLAQSFGLDRPRGALVAQVEKGSPAEKAGLKPGDVLLGVNGKTVERSAEVPPLVAAVKPGEKATLNVWRDGKPQNIAVTVGRLEADKTAQASPRNAKADTGKLGLAVRPSKEGLVVENVSGAAARAGIREGDVVTAVNGKPVKSVEDLRVAADKAKGNVAVLIKRGDASIFVPIEIG
jgi:serine protease Do